ncbi:hypothetical protein Vafri_17834 [Volvox africanus]|uniref:Guanylate cyclase domain-containing protein n=1 Tax=Volvox africanus TaxID=51714 RepID=A0A8J4BKV2_9CHLO|nr:hypothetical protein Vafri_17834 [Volvox africanus]
MVSWITRCFGGTQEPTQGPGDSTSSSPEFQAEQGIAAARNDLSTAEATRNDALLASTLDMDRFVEPEQADGCTVNSLDEARQVILRLKARVRELEGSVGQNAESTLMSLRQIRLPEQEARTVPTPVSVKKGHEPMPSIVDAIREVNFDTRDEQKSVPHRFCVYAKQELVELLGRAGKPAAAVLLQAVCEEDIGNVPPALLLDVDPAMGDAVAGSPELMAEVHKGRGPTDFSQLASVDRLPGYLRLRLYMMQACGARPMLAHATATARALFKVRTDRQLQYVLEGQVQQDAMLGMLLQEMLDEMLSAPVSRSSATSTTGGDRSTIIMHSLNHFVNTSNPKVFPFVPVSMRGCGYKKTSGEVVPCIIFEFSPDSNQGAFLEHLQRDYTMMGHISAIITLFTLKGDVLHQNAGSIAYYGYQRRYPHEKRRGSAHGVGRGGKRSGGAVPNPLENPSAAWLQQEEDRPVLTQLFQYAPPDALEGMLESMVQGGVWRSILPVPLSLAPSSRPLALPGGIGDPLAGAAGVPPGAAFMGPDPENIFTIDGLAYTGANVMSFTQPYDEPSIGRPDVFEGSFALGTPGSNAASRMAGSSSPAHIQPHPRSMRALKAVPEQSQEHERVSFAQHRQMSSPGSGDANGPTRGGVPPGNGGDGVGENMLRRPSGSTQDEPSDTLLSPRPIRSGSNAVNDSHAKPIKVPRRSTTFSAVPSGMSELQARACSGSTIHGMGTAGSFTSGLAACNNSSPRLSRIRRRSGVPLGMDMNPADALSQSTWGLFGTGAYEHRYDRISSRDAGGIEAEHTVENCGSSGRRFIASLAGPTSALVTGPAGGPPVHPAVCAAASAAGNGAVAAAVASETAGATGASLASGARRSEAYSPSLASPSLSSQIDQWQQWQYRHSQWQDALNSQSQPSQASVQGPGGPGRLSSQPPPAWFLHQQHQAGLSQSSSSAANQWCVNSSSRRAGGAGVIDGTGGDAGSGVHRQNSVESMARRQRSVAFGEGMTSLTSRSTPTPSAGSVVSPQPSAHQHPDNTIIACTTFVATAGNAPLDPSHLRSLSSTPPASQPSRFLQQQPVGSPVQAPPASSHGGSAAAAAMAAATAAAHCPPPPQRAASAFLEGDATQSGLKQLYSVSTSVPATTVSVSLSGACPGIIGTVGGSTGVKQVHSSGATSASVRRAPMRQSERSNPNLVLPGVGGAATGTHGCKSATSFSFGSKGAVVAAAHSRPLIRMMSFLNAAPMSGMHQPQQQTQHYHIHSAAAAGHVSAAHQRHMVKRAQSGQLNGLLDPVMRTGSSKVIATGDGSIGAMGPGGPSSQNGARLPPSAIYCGSVGLRRQSIRAASSAALGHQVSEVDESSSLAVLTTMATLGNSREATDHGGHGSLMPDDEFPRTYHEVTATPFLDPVSKSQVVMVVQTDVTARVQLERRLADVMEAEHKLLENIFPRHVLEHIAHSAAVNQERASQFNLRMLSAMPDLTKTATDHEQVTILFADIVGFTSMCKEVPSKAVMRFLNDLYTRFDTLLDIYGVYKVETIGDCYMVAGGLISKDADGFSAVRKDSCDNLQAWRVLSFAKAMLRDAQKVLLPTTHEPVKLRVGIHTGPVVSGVVGTRMPRFCLFGDTINTASRMESTCPYGRIQVSAATHALVPDEDWEPTGGVQVKGKGIMETYLLKQTSSVTLPSNLASASMSTPGPPEPLPAPAHGSNNMSRLGIRPPATASAIGSGGSAGTVGGSTEVNATVAHGVISAVSQKIPPVGAGAPVSSLTGPSRSGMGGAPRDTSHLENSSGKNASFLFNTIW